MNKVWLVFATICITALINISATSSIFFGKVKTKEAINGSRKLSDSQKQVEIAQDDKSGIEGDRENKEWKVQLKNEAGYVRNAATRAAVNSMEVSNLGGSAIAPML